MEPKRLFDCLEYQLGKLPIPDMFAAKEGGKWKTYSTQEVSGIVNQLAAGLLRLGVSGNNMTAEGRDKVSIISKNRPDRKSTRLNSSHIQKSRMPSSA